MDGGGAAEDTAVKAEVNRYAAAAYDSRRDGLPPDAREGEGGDTILGRSMRRHAVHGRGVQCREYLAIVELADWVKALREATREEIENPEDPVWRQWVWMPLKNPVVAVHYLKTGMAFFAWVGGVGWLLALLTLGFTQEIAISFLIAVAGPTVIYKLCKVALSRGWVEDRNNVIFDRCTGEVEFTWKGKRKRLRFAELEAAVRKVGGYSFQLNYHLFLYHRATGMFVQEPAGRWRAWEVELEWEFLQQFMDVSRPLPDVPQFEPFRRLDPVTAEHDRRVGRPAEYWKHVDEAEAQEMHARAREAAKIYPWGLSREQALAMGWRPSGYGDGERLWEKAEASAGERAAG